MWQRLTTNARKAVFYAQEEARRWGREALSTEHLLLGLLREDNTAVRTLSRLGFNPDALRTEIGERLHKGEARSLLDMTLTPGVKRVIDLAYREARGNFGSETTGTEHLLLGLLAEEEGLAGGILKGKGLGIEDARRAAGAIQAEEIEAGRRVPSKLAASPPASQPKEFERFDEGASIAFSAAKAMARASGAEFMGGEHLLRGILVDGGGAGVRLLKSLGVDPWRLGRELKSRMRRAEPGTEAIGGLLPSARRAIDLAHVEASDLGHERVGTEHLMLGLIRETEGIAGQALAQWDIDLARARLAVQSMGAERDDPSRNASRAPEVKKSEMWQRFTEQARKVVFYAQEETQKFGEGYVSTEHLSLGLVRESDGAATRVLEKLGVSLNRVRVEVEKQLPRGDARPSQDMTLTPRAKRVIDLAYEEARELNNSYIGTEHLLLGLVREGDGLAARVLAKLGVELERARREVMALQDQEGGGAKDPTERKPSPPPPDPWARFRDDARKAFVVAETEALGRGQSFRSPEHLLLGLLAEPESPACRALLALDVDLDRLREATESRCRVAPAREGEAPLSPAGGQAFTLAYKEQAMLGDERTGTEHVLLGLLREPDGVAGRILEEFGVSLTGLREIVRSLPGQA